MYQINTVNQIFQIVRQNVKTNLAWAVSFHILMILLLFALVYINRIVSDSTANQNSQTTIDHIDDSPKYGQMPLLIEKNIGQAPSDIGFYAKRGGYSITLNPSNFSLNARNMDENSIEELQFQFVGSNADAALSETKLLNSKTNYFKGGDQDNWIKDVPNYQSIKFENIYPGIDVKYYANGSRLQYDFIVSPKMNPDIIKVRVEGVDQITTNENNNLELHFNENVVELDNLLAYQEIDNNKIVVDAEYNIISDNEFQFKLGEFDSDYSLVIDPVVQYSTYLGGNGSDQGNDIVVDNEGNAYIIGQTSSTNFPTSTGSYDEVGRKGGFFDPSDVFVIKMNSEGSDYIYSTYISGGDSDIGHRIAIDDNGNAYIIGTTSSVDDFETAETDEGFPLVNAYQNFYGGDGDLFVAKLNSTGNQLLFSSYFGGESGDNTGQDKPGIALDNNGDIFISGTTMSLEFPTTTGAFKETGPGAFVSKLNNNGSSLLYSTFLGGDEFVFLTDLTVTGDGKALVSGFTANPDLPTTDNAYQQEPANGEEGFFYKLNQTGTGFEICTYFGGSGDDFAYGLDLDNSNNIYITALPKGSFCF